MLLRSKMANKLFRRLNPLITAFLTGKATWREFGSFYDPAQLFHSASSNTFFKGLNPCGLTCNYFNTGLQTLLQVTSQNKGFPQKKAFERLSVPLLCILKRSKAGYIFMARAQF